MSEQVKHSEEPLPSSPLEVLKSTALQVSTFEEEANIAIGQGDANRYKELIRSKAETIAGLDSAMEELSKRGMAVPDNIKNYASDWSELAKRQIEGNNYFGMGVLLAEKGSEEGDPNELEKLIAQLENPQHTETPIEIWNKLSEDGKKLAGAMAPGGGSLFSRGLLEAMAEDPEEGFELEVVMKELTDFGLLQQVTLIQEIRDELAKMPKPRKMFLQAELEVPKTKLREYYKGPTKEEDAYLSLHRRIEDYDKNHEQFPEQYKKLDELQFKLSLTFQEIVSAQPKGVGQALFVRGVLRRQKNLK